MVLVSGSDYDWNPPLRPLLPPPYPEQLKFFDAGKYRVSDPDPYAAELRRLQWRWSRKYPRQRQRNYRQLTLFWHMYYRITRSEMALYTERATHAAHTEWRLDPAKRAPVPLYYRNWRVDELRMEVCDLLDTLPGLRAGLVEEVPERAEEYICWVVIRLRGLLAHWSGGPTPTLAPPPK